MLSEKINAWVLEHTGATAIEQTTLIQGLWSGYGQLLRLHLQGQAPVILKSVVPPETARASVSDLRKRRSYQVEQAWYEGDSQRCDRACRVARCLASEEGGESALLLLEDLGAAGYHPHRPPRAGHIAAGLDWLASFHAKFLGQTPSGLWEQGGYWHLETRQDEWNRMPPGPLKAHASAIDTRLRQARYQTVMHGDSKPSNFCWHANGSAAAVDFQYIGPGCGIRDVAYFLDSCLGDDGCEQQGEAWLDRYFSHLTRSLQAEGQGEQSAAVEQEWRALFPVAWSDYARFYEGWGRPGTLGRYSQKQLELTLKTL